MENEEQNPNSSATANTDPSAIDSEFDELEADEQELEGLTEALGGINQLTELGNQALQLRLIVGHGYHGGQYEILRKGEVMTLEPGAAVAFLQNLITQKSSAISNAPQPSTSQGSTQEAEG